MTQTKETKEAKRMGRPPGKQWPHHLSIYLSDEQLKALEAIAWKEQRPVGYVAREMIARGLAKREKVG